MSELESKKHIYGFDRELRASLKNMKNVKIAIPILSDGSFDITYQEDRIKKFNVVNDLKSQILKYKQKIKDITVTISVDFEAKKEVKINEIFDTSKGLSKYTKKYGQEHKGDYPVYSASNIVPLTYINTFDYDGKYLTWATNGFAGYIKVIDEKFSANGDRGILIPKDDNVDLEYMRFIIEPILRELAKGRKGDKGKDEFTKVYPSMVENVTITVPILENGNLDLNTQKEIAEKYLKIEEIKKNITEELEKIEKIPVEY